MGSLKLKVEPFPSSEFTQMVPPMAVTRPLQIESPNPVPGWNFVQLHESFEDMSQFVLRDAVTCIGHVKLHADRIQRLVSEMKFLLFSVYRRALESSFFQDKHNFVDHF